MIETQEGLVVVADMPGVDQRSVDVTLEDKILRITRTTSVQHPEGYSLAYAEYEEGGYERACILPEEIDREKIQATVKDDVLSVVLPKAESAKARKIPVKTA